MIFHIQHISSLEKKYYEIRGIYNETDNKRQTQSEIKMKTKVDTSIDRGKPCSRIYFLDKARRTVYFN